MIIWFVSADSYDPKEMFYLLDIGVDGIISDNINELKNILVESEFW